MPEHPLRIVRDGDRPKMESDHSRFRPEDKVICDIAARRDGNEDFSLDPMEMAYHQALAFAVYLAEKLIARDW